MYDGAHTVDPENSTSVHLFACNVSSGTFIERVTASTVQTDLIYTAGAAEV